MFLSYPESLQYTYNKCVYIQATLDQVGRQLLWNSSGYNVLPQDTYSFVY